jgi:voltage-gated potassium channel Kch
VTLTTVGYGDITAASDIAKRLVVVEAFIGQVFLITLVARLVSLWGKRLR